MKYFSFQGFPPPPPPFFFLIVFDRIEKFSTEVYFVEKSLEETLTLIICWSTVHFFFCFIVLSRIKIPLKNLWFHFNSIVVAYISIYTERKLLLINYYPTFRSAGKIFVVSFSVFWTFQIIPKLWCWSEDNLITQYLPHQPLSGNLNNRIIEWFGLENLKII